MAFNFNRKFDFQGSNRLLSVSDITNDDEVVAALNAAIALQIGVVAGIPTGGTTGQVLAKTSNADGAVAWTTPAGGGGGATNLTMTRNGTTVTILSDTGTDAVIPVPDASNAGLLLPAEKTKLAGVATGATANAADATLLARANHTGTQSADTLTDGSTNRLYTTAEKNKLSAVAANATQNSTDATLLNRANHTGTQTSATISDFLEAAQDIVGAIVEGAGIDRVYNDTTGTTTISAAVALDDITDVDISGAVNGQVLAKDPGGGWTAQSLTVPNSDPGILDDLTDVSTATPSDGGLLVFSNNTGQWDGSFGMVGNLILASGATVPAGTPPCMVWDLPTSILKSHPIEGTNAATVVAATENFNSFNGTAVTYTNAQALVGTTSFLVASGNTGYFSDTGLAVTTIVLKGRVRTNGTPSGNTNLDSFRIGAGSSGNLQRTSGGLWVLKDGAGITRATSTVPFTADTWYQFEHKISGSTQTLRIFNSAGTQLESISGACTAGTIDTIRYGIDTNLNGSFYFDKASVAADWMGATG